MDPKSKQLFSEEILTNLLDRFGIARERAQFLGGFENSVYLVKGANQGVIIRVGHTLHRSDSEIASELEFISVLKKNGLSVPEVILSKLGNSVERIADGQGGYFLAVCFIELSGTPVSINSKFDLSLLSLVGEQIALMHQISEESKASFETLDRPRWDSQVVEDMKAWLPDTDAWVWQEYQNLELKIDNLLNEGHEFGLIHFDLHHGNYLVDGRSINIFDFDDCCFHYFVADIAIALFYSVMFTSEVEDIRANLISNFEALWKGYSKVSSLTDASLSVIPMLLRQRELLLYAVLNRSFDVTSVTSLPPKIQNFLGIFSHNRLAQRLFMDIDFAAIGAKSIMTE